MRFFLLFLLGIVLLCSCSPKIVTSISKKYAALDYRENVRVYNLNEQVPPQAEKLGAVKIGDTGFSTNCDWSVVLDRAKMEARKIGGNAIKIIKHIPPSVWGSSCHRITANILKIDTSDIRTPLPIPLDSSLIDADYALLHVYRFSGAGSLISFDLHLGDSVICRVKNKWKTTLKITKDGLNSLWARTEKKTELPINIKFGKEYYIRCSLTMGLFVGHPQLELVDSETGKAEYDLIVTKPKNNKKDDLYDE